MSKKKLQLFLSSDTARLAGTYLAVIMLMSLLFSVVFYHTSVGRLDRPPGPVGRQIMYQQFDDQVQVLFEQRVSEAREALIIRIIWTNIGILVAGGAASYLLARKSLRPIEEAMELQSQFVSDASHELRTPLTVLQTTNEVALRKKSLPPSSARELIEYNVSEVKSLRKLTDSLLDLLKDPKSPVKTSAVNLSDVVSESLGSIVKIAQTKDIEIIDEVQNLRVKSDKHLLTRIVSILLDNAVKYSENGSHITLDTATLDSKVYLSVVDQGMGIKATDLPHIFRRFYRADKSRTSGDSGGYGLGLSIADKISDQIGVKIIAESQIGKGSKFTVALDRA